MRTRTLLLLVLSVGLLWAGAVVLSGCGGNGFLSSLGFNGGSGAGGQPVSPERGPREEFNHTLLQIQWACIALGVAGLIASIWVPLISTRHAAGALVVGIGVALVRPILVSLYWPTIAIVALAGIAAAWPYLVAIYAWCRARFTGQPLPVATVGIGPSLKSLIMPRSKAAGPGFPAVPDGPGTSGDNLGVS
jgi:hypothetical protein